MSLDCTHPGPVRSRLSSRPRLTTLLGLACALLGACADGTGNGIDDYLGDGSFGSPKDPVPKEAGEAEDAAVSTMDAMVPPAEGVRLRVHQGVFNLPYARFCYDPDYVIDDPATRVDETSAGPDTPRLLAFNDGGSVTFGETTSYVKLGAMLSGAITVHRAPGPDAGGTGDAGVPTSVDAGLSRADASVDAGALAPPQDLPAVDAGGPCDPGSLEAVLPLPVTSAWLYPEANRDAGVDLDKLGVVREAKEGDTLTLFGSGLALDAAELERRRAAARQSYLAGDPTDTIGAEEEARRQVLALESVYGTRFLFAPGLPPEPSGFAISLAHLVPDVPSAAQQSKTPDAGSGALRLCVTVDMKESEPRDGGVARFEFRQVAPVGTNFDPRASYSFRLFAESDYQAGRGSCATTSLKPVAKLDVDAGAFSADRSYTLVASGAVAPANTCTSVNATKLVRQDCARAVDALNAQIQIVPNELPTP
jgi:hypothetical protein